MSHESISKLASDATYIGAGISTAAATPHYVFGLSMDEWSVVGIIFGMAMAVVGLAVNVYFKRQSLRLMRARASVLGEED